MSGDPVKEMLIATGRGNLERVRIEMSGGLDVNASNHLGYTALMSAARRHQVEIAPVAVSFMSCAAFSMNRRITRNIAAHSDHTEPPGSPGAVSGTPLLKVGLQVRQDLLRQPFFGFRGPARYEG